MSANPAITLTGGDTNQHKPDVPQGQQIVASMPITKLKVKQAHGGKIENLVSEYVHRSPW